MRQVVYWPGADRLVYLAEKATPQFWDEYWKAEGKPVPRSGRDDVVTISAKYLKSGARILEGGCGRGDKVQAMAAAGFAAIGVDFAEKAVRQAQRDFSSLDIRLGDVRALEFNDRTFDGYWSVGVIEHFWNGYEEILAEAARVLKLCGILFLTAPWLSPFRRHKVRAGAYSSIEFSSEPPAFFQFGLCRGEVEAALARHGFQVLRWQGLAADMTLKEEVTRLKRPISWLLGSRGSVSKRILRRATLTGLNRYCGHSFLVVARRIL